MKTFVFSALNATFSTKMEFAFKFKALVNSLMHNKAFVKSAIKVTQSSMEGAKKLTKI